MKVEKRKVLKLGISDECLQKLVRIHERIGTRTLTEALTRIIDEYETDKRDVTG